jgi:hypothetical protein
MSARLIKTTTAMAQNSDPSRLSMQCAIEGQLLEIEREPSNPAVAQPCRFLNERIFAQCNTKNSCDMSMSGQNTTSEEAKRCTDWRRQMKLTYTCRG